MEKQLYKGDMIRYIKIPSIFKVTFSLLLKNLSWKEAGGNVFFIIIVYGFIDLTSPKELDT
jgi:hypothetical protein